MLCVCVCVCVCIGLHTLEIEILNIDLFRIYGGKCVNISN
jgi:hypothetical protein